MRILQVAGTYPPQHCGVGDYVAHLAGALSHLSDVQIGVLTHSGASKALGDDVELLAVAQSWRISELAHILRAALKWNPELVHIHYPSQGFYGRILPAFLPAAFRMIGLKVVQTWHEPWPLGAALRMIIQRVAANGLVFVRPQYRNLMPAPLRCFINARLPQTIIPSAGVLPVSKLDRVDKSYLRERYLKGACRLVVFFGFIYPSKGVELLFEIANPETDTLIIAGASKDPEYLHGLKILSQKLGWGENVKFMGFMQPNEAADLLLVADAVVLPFLKGSGDWNTSLHAGLTQGTVVITTSTMPLGYDRLRNLYVARIGDVAEMRRALNNLAGRRIKPTSSGAKWDNIAKDHCDFYRELL